MRKTDYKVDKIKDYIINYTPSRTELVKFIATNLNGVSKQYFENNRRNFRGYYATNIQMMRNTGNIASKDGKYFVTKQGLVNENSLYNKPYKEQVKDLKANLDRQINWKNSQIRNLRDENKELTIRLKEMETTLYHIHALSK